MYLPSSHVNCQKFPNFALKRQLYNLSIYIPRWGTKISQAVWCCQKIKQTKPIAQI